MEFLEQPVVELLQLLALAQEQVQQVLQVKTLKLAEVEADKALAQLQCQAQAPHHHLPPLAAKYVGLHVIVIHAIHVILIHNTLHLLLQQQPQDLEVVLHLSVEQELLQDLAVALVLQVPELETGKLEALLQVEEEEVPQVAQAREPLLHLVEVVEVAQLQPRHPQPSSVQRKLQI